MLFFGYLYLHLAMTGIRTVTGKIFEKLHKNLLTNATGGLYNISRYIEIILDISDLK